MLVAATLLVGVAGLAVELPGPGLRNWLVVLFQLNAGAGDLPVDPLRVVNPIDFGALILVGITFLGLCPMFGKTHRLWMTVAVALPFAGIAVFLVTHEAGRSAVMAAGLVLAYPMLKSPAFKPLANLGILANAFLLVGDFATGDSRALVVAAFIGVGYVLLIAWFLLIGRRLLEGGGGPRKTQASVRT